MLFANRAKKGYYIQRVKEALWSTFGKTRIQPFSDEFSKEKIKAWKEQLDVRQVYNDLYKPIDPNNSGSDTYVAVIVRSVFAEKECHCFICFTLVLFVLRFFLFVERRVK